LQTGAGANQVIRKARKHKTPGGQCIGGGGGKKKLRKKLKKTCV